MQPLKRPGKSRRDSRRGLAVVELAISLPLLLMLTFATIEASNAIYLKQSLTLAAYEAARTATGPGGTEDDGQLRADEILGARNIRNSSVSFSPRLTANLPTGTAITITVSAPSNSNSVGPQWHIRNSTIRAQVVMPRL
ncbi:MAG: pilus assembly protein [Planctomyces sp.]|nr:pilus assembly protein [Planctomyces sp.]